MTIIFSDETDRLTPELWHLMESAGTRALDYEFGESFKSAGIRTEDAEAEIGVTIVDEAEILELNREYREVDKVTDVLSFPQFADREELLEDLLDDETETLIGDVVICYDQAVRQSEEYCTGITRELIYLFVHSVFHLFGYDHMEEDERRIMRAREEAVLSSIGVVR